MAKEVSALSITMDAEVVSKIRKAAAEDNRTVSNYIETVFKEIFRKKERSAEEAS